MICWTGFQVRAFMRQRILYVDPEATEPRLEGAGERLQRSGQREAR